MNFKSRRTLVPAVSAFKIGSRWRLMCRSRSSSRQKSRVIRRHIHKSFWRSAKGKPEQRISLSRVVWKMHKLTHGRKRAQLAVHEVIPELLVVELPVLLNPFIILWGFVSETSCQISRNYWAYLVQAPASPGDHEREGNVSQTETPELVPWPTAWALQL